MIADAVNRAMSKNQDAIAQMLSNISGKPVSEVIKDIITTPVHPGDIDYDAEDDESSTTPADSKPSAQAEDANAMELESHTTPPSTKQNKKHSSSKSKKKERGRSTTRKSPPAAQANNVDPGGREDTEKQE